MNILPPVIQPPNAVLSRRHSPRHATRYQDYRACLLWETGFTCPFCLLPDAAFMAMGTSRFGILQIEHLEPQSVGSAASITQYDNLILICALCNRARSALPLTSPKGQNLLNPFQRVWGDLFQIADDQVQPRDALDRDALYTHKCYRLGDQSKTGIRKRQREVISKNLTLLEELTIEIRRLRAQLTESNKEGVEQQSKSLRVLQSARSECLLRLQEWKAIPSDAPSACRCPDTSASRFEFPEYLKKQLIEVSTQEMSVCDPDSSTESSSQEVE